MKVSGVHAVTELKKTCNACPAQWEGRTSDGRWVYVRYRWGGLRIGFGADLKEAVRDDDSFYLDIGDDMDGCLTGEQLREATRHLPVVWPQEITTPKGWEE